MNEFIEKIYRYIEKNKMLLDCERVVVGLSGGADSVCLLIVLKKYIESRHLAIDINAVHVNHGIRQEAGEDEEFARALCERMSVTFTACHIDALALARSQGMTVEEAGRCERYRIFERVCEGAKAKIAVAHHMNDQAETVLMNMARGASLKGIGGIRPVRGNIIRPLLCITRAEVEQILKDCGQSYVTDATNLCNDYTRNAIRNVVIPYFTDNINSNSVHNFANAASELQKDFDFIEEEADKAYRRFVTENISGDDEMDGSKAESWVSVSLAEGGFAHLHEVIRKRVIYRAVLALTGKAKDVYRTHINSVDELVGKGVGSSADICYGLCATRKYDEIIIEKGRIHEEEDTFELVPDIEPGQSISFDIDIYMHETGDIRKVKIILTIYSNYEKNRNYCNSYYAKSFDYDKIAGRLCIRFRHDGDRMVVNSSGDERKLKKEFIDRKVPESMRNKVLLVSDEAGVLWAMGVRRSERAYVDGETRNVLEIRIEEQ